MKTEKFAEQLRTAMTKATEKLEAAEVALAHWKQREADAKEVLKRFRTALDALNGPKVIDAQTSSAFIPEITSNFPAGAKVVALNGEPVILEPGYEIGRNSFGEECIVPVGTKAMALPEPTKTTSLAESLSPPDDIGFDDPKNLI